MPMRQAVGRMNGTKVADYNAVCFPAMTAFGMSFKQVIRDATRPFQEDSMAYK